MTTPFESGGAQQSGAQQGGTATAGLKQDLKDQVGEAKNRIADQARNTVQQARDKAASTVNERKGQLAGSVTSVAGAVRGATDQLRGEGHDRIAGYTEALAEQADRVARYLRDTDLNRVRDDIEDLARRQPALVIGGALLLGVLAARFLKSSDRRTHENLPAVRSQWDDYYPDEYATGGFDATAY
jgi:hypothetical protein